MASDLISRAALLDEFHALCGPQTGDGWDNMGVYNLIVRQKAVDAAPVVHARWICYPECLGFDGAYLEEDIVCSNCKDVWNIIDNDTERFYCCPNCGAKMDGGEG